MKRLNTLRIIGENVSKISDYTVTGKVVSINGMLIEADGLSDFATIGSRCHINVSASNWLLGEVVGFRNGLTLIIPFGKTSGIGRGTSIRLHEIEDTIYPNQEWRGRILNAFGEAIDGKGPLSKGSMPYYMHNDPPPAYLRKRLGPKIRLGIKAIDTMTPCCKGQRLGVFAGSGVGKSMLIAMCTKFAKADIKIIGLVGERGREVQEFIEDYLGEEGLKNAIVIVSTSDESALARKRAAYLTLALSEYFRDQGQHVLCMLDNVTRFAMAQREIGLAVGEPHTTKGYTPSVFAELPKLLERAGPGLNGQGDITALFSILVDNDDHNEPIADATRGTLDGHIVLSRNIAQRRYPAMDLLQSISRAAPMCNSDLENKIITHVRNIITIYEDMSDMIKLGIYKSGTDKVIDEAIKHYPQIEEFMRQQYHENSADKDIFQLLSEASGFS